MADENEPGTFSAPFSPPEGSRKLPRQADTLVKLLPDKLEAERI